MTWEHLAGVPGCDSLSLALTAGSDVLGHAVHYQPGPANVAAAGG